MYVYIYMYTSVYIYICICICTYTCTWAALVQPRARRSVQPSTWHGSRETVSETLVSRKYQRDTGLAEVPIHMHYICIHTCMCTPVHVAKRKTLLDYELHMGGFPSHLYMQIQPEPWLCECLALQGADPIFQLGATKEGTQSQNSSLNYVQCWTQGMLINRLLPLGNIDKNY